MLEETKNQAKVIRNAATYLTDEARGSISGASSYHRYGNQYSTTDASVNVRIDSMQVRNDNDIRRIAREIASLGKRTSFGYGG